MKRFILALILVLIVFSFSRADIYVKTMQRTEAFEIMGRKNPETVEIKEQWAAKNKFVQFSKEISIIVDYEKEKLFFIVNKPKIYYEFPTNIDRAKLKELLPPKIADIIAAIKITDVKTKLNGLTKKIANWNCYGVDLEMVIMIPEINIMPKFKIRTWMTKDLPFDYKDYRAGMSELYERFFLGILNLDEKSKKEFDKLNKVDGFEIASKVSISIFGTEIKAEIQCLEITEKPAPAGIYSVPMGYTKKTIDLHQLGLQEKIK